MPAADDEFVPLGRVLSPPATASAPPEPPCTPVVAEVAELAALARDVRMLGARLTDAETLLADVLERLP